MDLSTRVFVKMEKQSWPQKLRRKVVENKMVNKREMRQE